MSNTATAAPIDQILDLTLRLSSEDKLRLIDALVKQLLSEPQPTQLRQKSPRRSLRGILAGLGPAPSAEDIDEVRREMLANFPSDDI